MSDSTILYDKKRVEDSVSLLSEIRSDLAEADDLLYNAIIKIVNAKGFPVIEGDDPAIDMRMPETLIVQCREEAKKTINQLNNISYSVEAYSKDDSVVPKTEEKTTPSTQPSTTVETTPETSPISTGEEEHNMPIALYGPGPGPSSDDGNIPVVLYGPGPGPSSDDGNIPVVLYGPGPGPSSDDGNIPVALYGPGPGSEEIYTSPPETIPVMLYGPGPSPEKIYTSPPETIPVMLYAPGPSEESIQQNRIYNPIGGQGSSEETSSYTPSPVPETSPNVEYSSIPDTAVGMEMDVNDYIAPLAAGLSSGIAGLVGVHQIRKRKEEEKEQEDDDIELLDDNKK